MKKCLLFTSGGIDSTYLLIKNIELDNEIYPIYLDIDCVNPEQKNQELLAIRKILSFFGNLKKVHFLKQVKVNWLFTEQDIAMPQIFITWAWLIAMSDYNYNVDEVQLGYCLNDDAVSYIKEMNNLWDSFSSFMHLESKYSAFPQSMVPPKLCFPLIEESKQRMAAYLNKKYPDILKTCWWCENPHISSKWEIERFAYPEGAIPCGKCPSCRRMAYQGLLEPFFDKAILFLDNARKEYQYLDVNVLNSDEAVIVQKKSNIKLGDVKELKEVDKVTLDLSTDKLYGKAEEETEYKATGEISNAEKEILKIQDVILDMSNNLKRYDNSENKNGIKDIDIESIR
jgi:7-cyano-7-deazaguanine synthase in queuosine biosynthesis